MDFGEVWIQDATLARLHVAHEEFSAISQTNNAAFDDKLLEVADGLEGLYRFAYERKREQVMRKLKMSWGED